MYRFLIKLVGSKKLREHQKSNIFNHEILNLKITYLKFFIQLYLHMSYIIHNICICFFCYHLYYVIFGYK